MAPTPGEQARRHALDVLDWRGVLEALASRCATTPGSRLARALQPGLSEAELLHRRALIEEARWLMAFEPPPRSGVRDITALLVAASEGRILETPELADVARSLDAIGRLATHVRAQAAQVPQLSEETSELDGMPHVVHAIEAMVDERGGLRGDATPLLRRLGARREDLARRIESKLDSLRRDAGVAECLSDDFVTVRDGRHVLPVRTDRRNAVPGILHGRSGSGHSLFIEPAAVVELNNDLRATELEIDEEVVRILRELSTLVARHGSGLRLSLGAHARLDFLFAAAQLADELEAVTPARSENDELRLIGLAHPLLQLLVRERGLPASTVVRNDVFLEGGQRGVVISGPNTGGKTVLLKAVGLAFLMSSAGLPVSARLGSRLPRVEATFADIGDEQSLARSLSSFSAHVAHLGRILEGCREARGSALVLLDELMSGTDPDEGAALAEAFLVSLADTGARAMATTHLGRLKALAPSDARWVNAGMEFDGATLAPTYRMHLGVPGASAALHVAEKLGLPEPLVAHARALVSSGALAVEALVRDLDAAKADALRLRESAASEEEAARVAREELELRLSDVRSRDARAITAEREAAIAEIQVLRGEAARIVRELQASPSLPAATEAIRRMDELRAKAGAAVVARVGAAGNGAPSLEPGARVHSSSLDRDGVVLEGPDARGRVRVSFGALTMQVPQEDLGASASKSPKIRGGGVSIANADSRDRDVPFTPQSPGNTLDLRGDRVDEALSKLSRFLEQARERGERQVILIHGHGTGALKAAIREELPRETRIGLFRPGQVGEGGDGVTVASLC